MTHIKAKDVDEYCALCVHGEADIHACRRLHCSPETGKPDWVGVKKSCLNCKYQINDGHPKTWIDGLKNLGAKNFLCLRKRREGEFGIAINYAGWCKKWEIHQNFSKRNVFHMDEIAKKSS